MKKVILATVTQEGRFLKAITTEGKDVSNQIDRGIRRAAMEQNVQVQLDEVTNTWFLANRSEEHTSEPPVTQ